MNLGNFGPFELIFILVVWLIPLAVVVWLVAMVTRLVRASERIAASAETIARRDAS
ncbi:MAG: hypothetical protein ACT4OZ_12920 [Gemmatimonadota bacterium]